MKIAVCDDQAVAREYIVQMIQEYNSDAEVFSFSSGREMLESGRDFDISFLDIEMHDMSGMETAKKIREKQERNDAGKNILIFVTAYRDYMEEAFDVNAYHYLIKPIEKERFISVLDRAWKDAAAGWEQSRQYLLIKEQGVQKKIRLRDILYVESYNRKVVIHTMRDTIEAYGKMQEMEQELGDSFFRCHRCYLVNMEKISAYTIDTIQLVNGEKLILAQKKYAEFVQKYMRYARDGGVVNV